jgi:formate hydrogenlyase subunit 4
MELFAPSVILIGQLIALPFIAPLFFGLIGKAEALLRGEPGAPLLQPYRELRQLISKDHRLPERVSTGVLAVVPFVLCAVLLTIGFGLPSLSLAIPEVSEGFGVPLAAVGEISGMSGLFFLVAILRGIIALDSAGRSMRLIGRRIFRELWSAGVLAVALIGLSLITRSGDVFGIALALQTFPYIVWIPVAIAFAGFFLAAFGERIVVLLTFPKEEEQLFGALSGVRLALVRLAGMMELAALALFAVNLFLPAGLSDDVLIGAFLFGLVTTFGKLTVFGFVLVLFGYRYARVPANHRLVWQVAAGFLVLFASVIFLGVYA